jgi:hypothetical protein
MPRDTTRRRDTSFFISSQINILIESHMRKIHSTMYSHTLEIGQRLTYRRWILFIRRCGTKGVIPEEVLPRSASQDEEHETRRLPQV